MIDVASGRIRADIVLKNANVVNMFTDDVINSLQALSFLNPKLRRGRLS